LFAPFAVAVTTVGALPATPIFDDVRPIRHDVCNIRRCVAGRAIVANCAGNRCEIVRASLRNCAGIVAKLGGQSLRNWVGNRCELCGHRCELGVAGNAPTGADMGIATYHRGDRNVSTYVGKIADLHFFIFFFPFFPSNM
jgi:hypothetical protein